MYDVNTKIHPNDEMLAKERVPRSMILGLYYEWGRSANEIIKQYLAPKGVHKILDFPSGYGRVMRHIAATYRRSVLFACDMQSEGVDFCNQEFGAVPLYAPRHIANLSPLPKSDLIWSGSLTTHLNEEDVDHFFNKCKAALISTDSPLIFTFHKRKQIMDFRMQTDHYFIKLEPEAKAEFLAEYDEKGFAFRPYEGCDRYGITIATVDWWLKKIIEHDLDLIEYQAAGWNGDQDYFVVKKRQN